MLRLLSLAIPLLVFIHGCETLPQTTSTFASQWSDHPAIERPWAGGEYWLNPLQAWMQKHGKLQCEVSGGDRNAVLLTHTVSSMDNFTMKVNIENLQPENRSDTSGWVGFQIGLKGAFNDYRDDAVHGRGLCLGLTNNGKLFIGDHHQSIQLDSYGSISFQLQLTGSVASDSNYHLSLQYLDSETHIADTFGLAVHHSWIQGLVALACSQTMPTPVSYNEPRPHFRDIPELGKQAGGNTRYAFSGWMLEGEAVAAHPERRYGPIMWTQYTLSDSLLKMSVQLAPVGNGPREVVLMVDGKEIQKASVAPDGNNALFRIENWNNEEDHIYEVLYIDATGKTHRYGSDIPKNPDQNSLKVASLSCVDDVGFPHQDLVENVLTHQADVYLFHGDQIYERVGGYGVERSSTLDYLRKWYIWGWSFRDFFKNRPVIIIPDDHDVFHGNLWGEGGKRADVSLGWGYDSQDDGGYKEPPEFVNMVHRTQTGHLPDPYDPTPVLNDISVYYTNMNYGGLSFAILGDRQWKSAPKYLFPEAEIENGWPQNTTWNPKTQAFHPNAQLLGDRQEAFLEKWVKNWSENTRFKVLVSQSPFCNVATLPKDIYHDKYVPGLPRYKPGEYPPDDRPVADFDSNGWPQNKRDKAIKIIRKGFALHLTGDQHLGSTGQYGVDEFGDGNYWVSCPAVSNLWPRRWYPAQQATGGRSETDPRYVGEYEDGFGNKITVKAIANPYDLDRHPDRIYDKAPGYSILTFNKADRSIQIAIWPRWASPHKTEDNKPYPGWPITIAQEDNYGAEIAGFLPKVEVDGNTTVQVIDETSGVLIYAINPPVGTFSPKVFDAYTTYEIRKVKEGKIVEKLSGLKIKKS